MAEKEKNINDKKKDAFSNIGIAILISLLIILFRISGFLMYLELSAYDLYLRYFSQNFKPESNIVVISISEDDMAWLNSPDEKHIDWKTSWPMNDHILTRFLKKLNQLGPIVIGLDIYRDQALAPGTEELTAFFAQEQSMHGVVSIQKFGDDRERGIDAPYSIRENIKNGVYPPQYIHKLVGSNDVMFDSDGIVRRGLLGSSYVDKKSDETTEDFMQSFAMVVANNYLYTFYESMYLYSPETKQFKLFDFKNKKPGGIDLNRIEVNSGAYTGINASGFQMLMDYRGGQEKFKTFSLQDIICDRISEDDIFDKIVLVGSIADSSNDFFFTPFSKSSQSESKMPGVFVHANLVSQLIRFAEKKSKPMYFIEDGYEWVWIFVWSLIGGTIVVMINSPILLTLAIMLVFVFLVIFTYIIFMAGCWLPVVPPVLAFFLSAFFRIYFVSSQEKVQKAQLMQLFSRHVSSDVAAELWDSREDFMDGNRPRPKRLTATVIFTDLAGFTAISEKMEPDVLMDWLNGYMSRMARIIAIHHGVIDKFIGDAIMAVFGIPMPRTTEEEISQDAKNAVTCVVEMGKELDRLNEELKATGMPTIKMRVGVYTGPLVAGSIGSDERVEYTVLGDTVNTASRLESLKGSEELNVIEGSIRIIIGTPTKERIGDLYKLEEVGGIHLKGKEEAQTVYKVITNE